MRAVIEETAYGVLATIPAKTEDGETIPRSERIAKVIRMSLQLGMKFAARTIVEGEVIALLLPLGDGASDQTFTEAADMLLAAAS
jgi:hypothetical protein